MFILYSLAQYIETDYCLIVQNDGWVLNGKNWRDEFWDYDYIGSPVLYSLELKINERNQTQIYRNDNLKADSNRITMNGGFSLRSKRLLEMPRKLGVSVPVYAPEKVESNQCFKFYWGGFPVHNEDLFLNHLIRPQLEAAGIKFAPLPVAQNFSFEDLILKIQFNIPIQNCLGHHFFGSKVRITGINSIVIDVPYSEYQNDRFSSGVSHMLETFMMFGYQVSVNLG